MSKTPTRRQAASATGSKAAAGNLRRRANEMVLLKPVRDGSGHTTLALAGSFDVASSERTRRPYYANAAGADFHQDELTLSSLREMGHHLDRNSAVLHGIFDRFVDNVVGPNFGFRPNTADKGWNTAAYEWMVEHQGTQCDVRGLFDWQGILRTSLRSLCPAGDSLLVHNADSKIQPIESHQLVTPRDFPKESENRVVNGVELDRYGRPQGYWISEEKYGQLSGFVSRMANATRIDAGDAVFPAYRTRFTQTRGVPIAAAALSQYTRLDRYIDNESLAAEIDSCLAFFIERDYQGDELAAAAKEVRRDGSTRSLDKIEPGMIARLRPGERVQPFGSNRPGTQFEPFLISSLRCVGASVGMPLELVLLDFSRTNYSSARAALLQSYIVFKVWQQWLIRTICQPIYRRWIAQAIARGELGLRDDALKVKWFPPSWQWVDPLKEIVALKEAVALGVATLTDQIESSGQTRDEYIAERKEEIEAFDAAGIPSTGMAGNQFGMTAEDVIASDRQEETAGDDASKGGSKNAGGKTTRRRRDDKRR